RDTAAKLHFFESGLGGTLMDIENPVIFGDQGHDADRLWRRHDDIVAGPALAFCVTHNAGQKRDPGRGTSASEAVKDGQGFSMAGEIALYSQHPGKVSEPARLQTPADRQVVLEIVEGPRRIVMCCDRNHWE